MNNRIKWSKELIKEKIKERYESGLSLNFKELDLDAKKLHKAANRYFENWTSALIECDIEPEKNLKVKRNYWTKEIVLEKINDRYKSGLSISTSDVKKSDYSLYTASVKLFGKWSVALSETGYIIEDHYKLIYWNKEIIIKELIERLNNNKPLNRNSLNKENPALLGACMRHFGSYENAIIGCGFNYDEIREDSHLMTYYGIKFEEVLRDILKEIYNKKIKKGFNFELQPDFNMGNGHWMDAKLSQISILHTSTVVKYEPHCEKLTIVYLRGDKDGKFQLTEKTEQISVYLLLNELSIDRIKYYCAILDKLWDDADKREVIINIENTKYNNNSQYFGIYPTHRNKSWEIKFIHKGENIYLGSVKTEEDAVKIYDDYIIENKLNKPTNIKFNPYFKGKRPQSKYIGVQWDSDKWVAKVNYEKKQIYVGAFNNEHLAASSINDYITKHKLNRELLIIDM